MSFRYLNKDDRRYVLSSKLWPPVMTHRFKFRYRRFAFYGLAALQIQYAWKNHQQNAIYDMSTRWDDCTRRSIRYDCVTVGRTGRHRRHVSP